MAMAERAPQTPIMLANVLVFLVSSSLGVGQPIPSSCFCADQAIGKSTVLIRRCAVSSAGWHPDAIAATISGAKKASGGA
jgi:hypothetical protein